MIDTYLFDIDGTLLDTKEFILQATEHSLAHYGYVVPDRSVIAPLVGEKFETYYFKLTGQQEVTDLINKHREFQVANLHLSTPFEGTPETLQFLHAQGCKLAAVTSRSKITSLDTLEQAGLLHFFDTVISSEDTPEVKPSPEPLLLALERLGKTPEQAVMVGDSHFDVEAGKNAGTKTVRATYGFHTDNLNDPKPDHFIDAIGELLVLEWN
jgi:pyrophosphatase PpaX